MSSYSLFVTWAFILFAVQQVAYSDDLFNVTWTNSTCSQCSTGPCPLGMRPVRENGTLTCQNPSDNEFFLLNTGGSIIKFIPQSDLTFERMTIIQQNAWPRLFYIDCFAYNFDRNEFYIVALMSTHRYLSKLDWNPTTDVWNEIVRVRHDLFQVRAMAYDVNTDHLFWIDESRGTLDVASTSGPAYRATLRRDLRRPVSLALYAQGRKWFISEADSNEIIALDFDGSNRRPFMRSSTGEVYAMTVGVSLKDPNSYELIWLNADGSMLTCINITSGVGTARDIAGGTSLTVANGTVYIVYAETIIFWPRWWKEDAEVTATFGADAYDDNIHEEIVTFRDRLQLSAGRRESRLHTQCRPGHHHCAHLCLLSLKQEYSCRCSVGYRLNEDGFGCSRIANGERYDASEADKHARDSWRERKRLTQSHEPENVFALRDPVSVQNLAGLAKIAIQIVLLWLITKIIVRYIRR